MPNEHVEMCPMSLVISELQVKTTARHHRAPIRVATVKKAARLSVGRAAERDLHTTDDQNCCRPLGKR